MREATERAEADHDRAEQANLAKSKFLAAASHDLRQPVHAQELFLEVLARSESSSPHSEMSCRMPEQPTRPRPRCSIRCSIFPVSRPG